MIRTLTITLPLPPKSLHPNARAHWGAKSRDAKKYQSDVMAMAHQSGVGVPFPKASLRLRYFVRTAHATKHDDDNLTGWFKAGRDALAKAGIVANDRDFTVLPPTCQKDAADPRLEVTITEIP